MREPAWGIEMAHLGPTWPYDEQNTFIGDFFFFFSVRLKHNQESVFYVCNYSATDYPTGWM